MREEYHAITTRILEQMELCEKNNTQFVLPFSGNAGLAMNPTTGQRYNGINQLLLSLAGQEHYAGYGQWQKMGCQVNKNEKAIKICRMVTVLEKEPKDPDNPKGYKYPKFLSVFGCNQITIKNVSKYKGIVKTPKTDRTTTIPAADAWIEKTAATVTHSDAAKAYYQPSGDLIHMPNRSLFSATPTSSATEAYYSTYLHELTHWSGSESRLNRIKGSRFGDQAYAMEELIAELGAAFQCQHLGVTSSPREDHAHYLNSWIKVLKKDARAIFTAATQAQAAFDYIENLQDQSIAA